MTDRTRPELALRVMKIYNLLMPGESISARDQADILERWDDAYMELVDEKNTYFEADAIPQEVFEAVAQYLAIVCASMFGFIAPTGRELTMALEGAKQRIKAKLVKPASQLANRQQYF